MARSRSPQRNTQPLRPAISNEAVLFLQRADNAQGSGWHIVSSGCRVSSAGRAYRFVQCKLRCDRAAP